MENWSLFEPIKIAKRYRNTKRSYLLVNTLQGKHIPVRPGRALQLFGSLGAQIHRKYPEASLVIGFSETATAIGCGAAAMMGAQCNYLTTTREETIENGDCLLFREEHSHAVEQKLYLKGLSDLIGSTKEIILVDDEISTGNTLRNIVRELREAIPATRDHAVVAASILNRVSPEQAQTFERENIFFESIFQASGIEVQLTGQETNLTAPSDRFYQVSHPLPDVTPVVIENARKPVTVASYLRNCRELADIVIEHTDLQNVRTVLVLGTEECMYPALAVAKELESRCHIRAFCHATTRSPICIGTEADYPMQNGFRLASFYDAQRDTYLYNLQTYDAAVLISDAGKGEAALRSMEAMLAACRIPKRYYFLGER